jgi:hypothetical protein
MVEKFFPYLSVQICVQTTFMIAGSCATESYQPRQVRKEAAAVTTFVCRGGAWLSPFPSSGDVLFSFSQKMAASNL